MYYGLLSLLMLVVIYILYSRIFKLRKKKAREVVMIALLSALTVVGNLVSFSALPLQLGSAMVIISGIAFGPEVGFLVGSIARLVANFFQGQGPWTIWEMMGWGILGAAAGFAFHKIDLDAPHSRNFKVVLGPVVSILFFELLAYVSYLLLPMGEDSVVGWRLYAFGMVGLIVGVILMKERLPIDDVTLALFSFFTVFLIYGGLLNICALFTGSSTTEGLALEALRLLYISGAPYDAWHGARTAIATFLIGPGLLRRLERVKVKYGFYRI